MPDNITRCGFIAIIGRPNVGKSTLLNALLGQKLSITSNKPQTTRQRLLGIKTCDDTQYLYVDTPGIHQQARHRLNRYMNKTASSVIFDADIIAFMVESLIWTKDDEFILKKLAKASCPILLVINKIDNITDKNLLLAYITELNTRFTFAETIPISARDKIQITLLEEVVFAKYLPVNQHLFAADQITDKSERFLAAEIVREKLMRALEQELPYSIAVAIEHFQMVKKVLHIAVAIWVEKPGQKKIVIGEGGSQLKHIGTKARLDMERLFGNKVFLQLWVKVRNNWADDERQLLTLGYGGDNI